MSESPIKKQALLIGINQYEILPELKYARQDAEAVEESLKQNYCFSDDEIMLLTDAKPGLFKPLNKHVIQTHLENLANQELDLFVFGFWGHGLFRNGERYLCPLDVMGDAVEDLGFSFSELQRLLSKIRAKNTCLILDCCQTIHDRGESETFSADEQKIMENAARDIVLKRKEQMPEFQSNVVILNSCKEGQAAYEWDKRKHGIFTAHLLDAFSRRYDSVAQIVGYTSRNVEKTAMELGKKQTPYSKLEGDIILPVSTQSASVKAGDVFISYSRSSADQVVPIEEELKRRGISFFIDRDEINYVNYSKAITTAISESKVLLLFWTADVKGSDEIVNEVALARKLKKTVIPYKVGAFNELDHSELCLHLASLNRFEVPVQTPETVMEAVNLVEQALRNPASSPVTNQGRDSSPAQPQIVSTPSFQSNSPESLQKKSKGFGWRTILLALFFMAVGFAGFYFIKNGHNNAAVVTPEPLSSETTDTKYKPESVSGGGKKQKLSDAEESSIPEPPPVESEVSEPSQQLALESSQTLPEQGSQAGERAVITVNGVEFAFRWCPSGAFMMGSPEMENGRYDNEKQRQITLSSGFWALETEVTVGMFNAFVNDTGYKSAGNVPFGWTKGAYEFDSKYSWRDPGFSQDDSNPVTCVSWDDAVEFCSWLSEKTGQKFQLPTEAQWEYACRAGTTGAYAAELDEVAWYNDNSGTHPVGTKASNAWGLYDMHGNVREWCQDWMADYSIDNVTDPEGPLSGSRRIVRGGGWDDIAVDCRSARRCCNNPMDRNLNMGFRFVTGSTVRVITF